MKTKRKVVKYIELILMIAFAFLLWYSAFHIIQTEQTESWWQPIGFFSLFFILWSLGAVLVKNDWLFLTTTALAIIAPFFFAPKFSFLILIVFAFLILWSGRRFVREEMASRIKISIWNSLRLERRFFVFAIAVILTGQYYFGAVKTTNENRELPKFKISDRQAKLATEVLSKFDPSFQDNRGIETMTVDEFITRKMSDELTNGNLGYLSELNGVGAISDENLSERKKELILAEGRKSFSKMAEREVFGNEKIIDVFSEIINKKISGFVSSNIGYIDQNIPIMHWIFTGLLFLSIFSVGMFLSPLLILLTWLLFKLMIVVGFVSIEKKPAEIEVIS